MNVYELKRILKDVDDDTEVRIASQQQWPFEYSVDVVAVTDPAEHLEIIMGRPFTDEPDGTWWIWDPDDEDFEPRGPFVDSNGAEIGLEQIKSDHTPVLYIAEYNQLGYLPGEARKAVGW